MIGVGGIGMSGLARLLIGEGALVTGSDMAECETIGRLVRMGASIAVGHSIENMPPEVDAVVISAAVRPGNPELQLARKRGLRVYKYAELLGEIFNSRDGIAMAGTHGKSTTSGWLAFLLRQSGRDCGYIVGAVVTQLGSSSGGGADQCFVAEACEYDRSFLNLRPLTACILNIERDHLDCYRDEADIVEAFSAFISGIKPGGTLIANACDPNVSRLLERAEATVRCIRFGIGEGFDISARNLETACGSCSFELQYQGQQLERVQLAVPGRHNVSNALAVAGAAIAAGIEPGAVAARLGSFAGIERRLQLRGVFDSITVMDDYAHHPTEIRASLEAIRQSYPGGRLWCVFQPHQYSRTRFLLDDFARSFNLADVTVVCGIYRVRDSASAHGLVSSGLLAQKIREYGTAAVSLEDFNEVCDYLESGVRPGDVVVTMGAGDVWKVADGYIQRLGKHC
jgi:UDP-N-acetylmuramate--alanine ligase